MKIDVTFEPSGYWVAKTDDCKLYIAELDRDAVIKAVHEAVKDLLNTDQPRYQMHWPLYRTTNIQ